jgi:hypothetical protein
MAASSNITSAFCNFSRLPKELRVLVWNELFPGSSPDDVFCSQKPSLSILRTSRQLSSEISHELYNGRIITFYIAPNSIPAARDLYSNPPSTIDVYDQFGSNWRLYPRFQKASDQQSYPSSVWKHLPFHKLKSVRFEVEAPDPADPGQLIELWNKLSWLLDLVQHVGGFPNVKVHALDTGYRNWCEDGEVRQTLTNKPPSMMSQNTTDLEILLSPILLLRNVESIEVHHPFAREHGMLAELVSDILRKARSITSFGLDFNDIHDMDDDFIMSDEDTWTVWFDYILDDFPDQVRPLFA